MYVNSAVNGMYVNDATYGMNIGYASYGLYMADSYAGTWIEHAQIGGFVRNADTAGFEVDGSGYFGVFVTGSAPYAGYFNGWLWAASGCFGCLQAVFGVNASDQPLQPGQVVTIQGMGTTTLENAPNLWQVAPAKIGQTAVGVVGGRAELRAAPSEKEFAELKIKDHLEPREGASQPGEYLYIIIVGPAQVQAGAEAASIQPGMRLVAGEDGLLRPLRTVTVEGVELAESTPTLGIALSTVDDKGLVWVMVNPR
jgi:hypothetical protein